jgi:hypothetical protein
MKRRANHRTLVTLLGIALAFYIVGTLDTVERTICLLAIVVMIYATWIRSN